MRALALIALLPAAPVQAEGRNDAFLRCTFGDSRITLAESGGAVVWREGDKAYAAACLGRGAPLAQCIAESDPPAVLILSTGLGDTPFGPARLLLTDSGLNQVSTDGSCEALTP